METVVIVLMWNWLSVWPQVVYRIIKNMQFSSYDKHTSGLVESDVKFNTLCLKDRKADSRS